MSTTKGQSRTQLANEAAQIYLQLGDSLRLATLTGWIFTDLTTSQVKALFLLAHHRVLTVSELARLLGVGSPAASILVQQLVDHALVERSEDASDRRRTLVRLTTQGAELISGQREQRDEMLRGWLSQLDDDVLAGLLRGLEALDEVVRSEHAEDLHSVEPVNTRRE